MDPEALKPTFIAESRERLADMEAALLAMEGTADPAEPIAGIFRAVHTIKGSAGLFDLEAIVRFSHQVESVMDRVRGGALALDPGLVGLLLECHDHLAQLLGDVEAGTAPGRGPVEERLAAALAAHLEARVDTLPGVRPEVKPQPAASSGHWHISVRFPPDCLRQGLDPLSCVRYLGTLGTLVGLHPVLEPFPEGDFDAERCYLGLEMDLDARTDRRTLEDAFEYIRDDGLVRIVPPEAAVEAYLALIHDLPEDDRLVGEILLAAGCITEHDLAQALAAQDRPEEDRKLGRILVEEHAVAPEVVAAALDKQDRGPGRQQGGLGYIKVAAPKLDCLVDLVGELVTAAAAAQTQAKAAQGEDRAVTCARVSQLVEGVRDLALSLRMVPIGDSFSRFRRTVRDVSRELGKRIDLETHGDETEVDKSIAEKLGDPLLHLVRNAIDHGIEPMAVRRERGKPEAGRLDLRAYHDSGSIVIEVADDGGGLDLGRIEARARERGLLPAGARPTAAQLTDLVFLPGFSTAAKVSDLSGRGVGMDVVRRSIEDLRGTVEVETREGAGTTFRIRLPLTLAIIDGFQVQVAGRSYVVPLDVVNECLDLGAFLDSEHNHLLDLRGEVLPFLRLRDAFRIPGQPPAQEQVLVVQFGQTRAGLVVDRLIGELQAVIKPLGDLLAQIPGVGGTTLLGSGEVALVLDVPQLLKGLAGRRPAAPPPS